MLRNLGDLIAVGGGSLLEDPGSGCKVRGTGVGARDKVGLVDLDVLVLELDQRGSDLDGVGPRNIGRQSRQVKEELLSIDSALVSRQSRLPDVAELLSDDTGGGEQLIDALVDELLLVVVLHVALAHSSKGSTSSQPAVEDRVDGEETSESAPLGGHVGNSQTVIHGDAAQSLVGSSELNGVVENLVLVEETSKRNDDILSCDTLGHSAAQGDLCNRRYLPPGLASRPDTRRISADYGCTQTSNTTVHVRVAVGGHSKCTRPRVAFLDHDLVTDTASGAIEDDIVLLSKLLNLLVLLQVLLGLVLDVVVEGHDDLLGVADLGRADGHELEGNRP